MGVRGVAMRWPPRVLLLLVALMALWAGGAHAARTGTHITQARSSTWSIGKNHPYYDSQFIGVLSMYKSREWAKIRDYFDTLYAGGDVAKYTGQHCLFGDFLLWVEQPKHALSVYVEVLGRNADAVCANVGAAAVSLQRTEYAQAERYLYTAAETSAAETTASVVLFESCIGEGPAKQGTLLVCYKLYDEVLNHRWDARKDAKHPQAGLRAGAMLYRLGYLEAALEEWTHVLHAMEGSAPVERVAPSDVATVVRRAVLDDDVPVMHGEVWLFAGSAQVEAELWEDARESLHKAIDVGFGTQYDEAREIKRREHHFRKHDALAPFDEYFEDESDATAATAAPSAAAVAEAASAAADANLPAVRKHTESHVFYRLTTKGLHAATYSLLAEALTHLGNCGEALRVAEMALSYDESNRDSIEERINRVFPYIRDEHAAHVVMRWMVVWVLLAAGACVLLRRAEARATKAGTSGSALGGSSRVVFHAAAVEMRFVLQVVAPLLLVMGFVIVQHRFADALYGAPPSDAVCNDAVMSGRRMAAYVNILLLPLCVTYLLRLLLSLPVRYELHAHSLLIVMHGGMAVSVPYAQISSTAVVTPLPAWRWFAAWAYCSARNGVLLRRTGQLPIVLSPSNPRLLNSTLRDELACLDEELGRMK